MPETESKLDLVIQGLGEIKANVAELTAWVKAERDRMDRVQSDLGRLRERHDVDIKEIRSREESLATKADLAALEADMVSKQRWIVGLLVTILVAMAGAAITLIPHLGG